MMFGYCYPMPSAGFWLELLVVSTESKVQKSDGTNSRQGYRTNGLERSRSILQPPTSFMRGPRQAGFLGRRTVVKIRRSSIGVCLIQPSCHFFTSHWSIKFYMSVPSTVFSRVTVARISGNRSDRIYHLPSQPSPTIRKDHGNYTPAAADVCT